MSVSSSGVSVTTNNLNKNQADDFEIDKTHVIVIISIVTNM